MNGNLIDNLIAYLETVKSNLMHDSWKKLKMVL